MFFDGEKIEMDHLLSINPFKIFEKFTFKTPNNYIIYDGKQKMLFIRFGNCEKYNFLKSKIFSDEVWSKEYEINLTEYHYVKLTKNIEKFFVISSEIYNSMFDQLLNLSKKEKEKEIEYHCFDSSKVKFEQENFKYVPVEKENEQEYSFKQIHFKYFGENIY